MINLYLEEGKKKVGASALQWPGWSRTAKRDADILDMMLAYAPRYARVLELRGIRFELPTTIDQFVVVERLEGDAGTDFGGPSIVSTYDREDHPLLDEDELWPMLNILKACWATFDQAVDAAQGLELRKGPRGGGRDLDKIVEHVVEAERSYIRRLASTVPNIKGEPMQEKMMRVRDGVEAALFRAVRDGLPAAGPRGGKIWTPMTYIRRSAWHLLDHVWEIEDRSIL